MTADAQACLDAMAAAEQEARDYLDGKGREIEYGAPLYVEDWARDRVALVARDRATLERHGYGERPGTEQRCVQAVIEFWTQERG